MTPVPINKNKLWGLVEKDINVLQRYKTVLQEYICQHFKNEAVLEDITSV